MCIKVLSKEKCHGFPLLDSCQVLLSFGLWDPCYVVQIQQEPCWLRVAVSVLDHIELYNWISYCYLFKVMSDCSAFSETPVR